MNEEIKNPENATGVSYIVFESAQARLERTIYKLWVVIILLIVLLVGSNAAWIWWESQWEDVSVTQDVDTGEGNAFVAGFGDVNYGESQADN